MAQIGTDTVETLSTAQIFVAPCALTIVGAAAALGTQGSTTSTLTVRKNGGNTSLTPTVGVSVTAGAAVAANISLAAGDWVDFTSALGTSAASPFLTLQFQRA